MTKKRLESYLSIKAEIEELQEKEKQLQDDESLVMADTVLDYRTGYGIPKSIVGFDATHYWRKKERYKKRIEELQAEMDEIEEWVEQIKDSLTRRIFRMSYIDGRNQAEVGKALHLERSGISRRISEYLRKE